MNFRTGNYNLSQVSNDGQYVLATGIYKPRLRCYDLHNLGMKFERCLDSEVSCEHFRQKLKNSLPLKVTEFCVLSEDYSKIVFMHCDRYIELHSQAGRYYRLRYEQLQF